MTIVMTRFENKGQQIMMIKQGPMMIDNTDPFIFPNLMSHIFVPTQH